AGTVDVTVTTFAGTSSTSSSDHFTYAGTPTITGLSLTSGSTAGGAQVTLTGTDFTGATDVSFGGAPAQYTINSDTSITATVPVHAAGPFAVTVSSGSGGSALVSADRFTYAAANAPVVSSLGTSSGSTAGGTSVTITGTDFTGATAVLFDGTPVASF